uniref:Uncharacterized protein n=1 Tax=Nelumbo nucifera TaxID=4432 RepID=A0A822ZIZ9_NELNU|nr:TPA_asm: hypothetical protein HUJ06_002843 [Nelumbo nucifera]
MTSHIGTLIKICMFMTVNIVVLISLSLLPSVKDRKQCPKQDSWYPAKILAGSKSLVLGTYYECLFGTL